MFLRNKVKLNDGAQETFLLRAHWLRSRFLNSILPLSRYNIPKGGKGLQEAELKQYTAEFLLTRGDYAMLGYSWYGCTGSAMHGDGACPDPPTTREGVGR